MSWALSHVPGFLNQYRALPEKEAKRIDRKIDELLRDPRPDGDERKKLVETRDDLHRIRSGPYRVIYTYNQDWVCLLSVEKRNDEYRGLRRLRAPELPKSAPPIPVDYSPDATSAASGGIDERPDDSDLDEGSWDRTDAGPVAQQQPAAPIVTDEPLVQPITPDILAKLKVPEAHHGPLLSVTTVDELSRAAVPSRWIDVVFDVVSETDLDRRTQEPVFETGDIETLERAYDDDLVSFLLRLDDDQLKIVRLSMDGGGPVLVKGSPGTGKTTIAAHRAKLIVEHLKAQGDPKPRLLFTTYTTTLVGSARQQIDRLLGDDAHLVHVATADSVAREISGIRSPICSGSDPVVLTLLRHARLEAGFAQGSGPLASMSDDYLLSEILKVIVARDIRDRDAYRTEDRAGRQVPLRGSQRDAVWAVAERFDAALRQRGMTAWEAMRRQAARTVQESPGRHRPYDAVLVDEVQDLDPTVIRMLTDLCVKPGRLFLTADANQSIYGGTFRWASVHADLNFQGRSRSLGKTYRTTFEIMRAAEAYLARDVACVLDADSVPASAASITDEDELRRRFPRRGADPTIVRARHLDDEAQRIARFVQDQAVALKTGIGSAAVLVPTTAYGQGLCQRLERLGVDAEAAKGAALDLSGPAVKVTTLQSSKGLEFPIVALAGLHLDWIQKPKGATPEERAEEVHKQRRQLYVGMTRAMRALLVVTGGRPDAPVLAGLEG